MHDAVKSPSIAPSPRVLCVLALSAVSLLVPPMQTRAAASTRVPETYSVTPSPLVTRTLRVSTRAPETYSVTLRGLDGNPCTLVLPCASLSRATALAAPGDIVVMNAGTYGPQYIDANGTPARPIVVRSQGRVVLTRPLPLTDAMQSTSLLRVAQSSYVVVSGFVVLGSKMQPGYNAADRPYGGEVKVENHDATNPGDGITLTHLQVRSANNTCIKTQDAEPRVTIADNLVVDCGQPGSSLDHGIYVSGPNASIVSNSVAGATGFGIHVYGNVAGARILSNTVSAAAYTGILDDVGPGLISGNSVFRNRRWGIRASPGVAVTFNVLAENGSMADSGSSGLTLSGGGVTVANNTFFQDGPHEISFVTVPTAPLVVMNNIFAGSSRLRSLLSTSDPGSSIDYNLFDRVAPYRMRPRQGLTNSSHTLVADPLFVNPGAAPFPDLRLRAGSPAADAGANVAWPAPSRVLTHDLGALSYNAGTAGDGGGRRGTAGDGGGRQRAIRR